MRLLHSKNLACLVFLIAIALGCKRMETLVRPSVLKSPDNKFQLTVPAGWRERKSLTQEASIGGANLLKEAYVVVITESKSDLVSDMTLDKFTEMSSSLVQSQLQNSVATPATHLTIDGKPARQCLIQGEAKFHKMSYLLSTVETAEHYHRIITWTLTSRISQNQPELEEVIESFREVSAAK